MGYDCDHIPQLEISTSINIGGYYDCARQRHNDHGEYSSTDYSNAGEYSTSRTEYWDFEYYHRGADIAQLPPPYYSAARSSSQSSQPTRSHQQTYYPYKNYIFDFYTSRGDDNDDFVSHHNSMWK